VLTCKAATPIANIITTRNVKLKSLNEFNPIRNSVLLPVVLPTDEALMPKRRVIRTARIVFLPKLFEYQYAALAARSSIGILKKDFQQLLLY
jgi:hypothetical protein